MMKWFVKHLLHSPVSTFYFDPNKVSFDDVFTKDIFKQYMQNNQDRMSAEDILRVVHKKVRKYNDRLLGGVEQNKIRQRSGMSQEMQIFFSLIKAFESDWREFIGYYSSFSMADQKAVIYARLHAICHQLISAHLTGNVSIEIVFRAFMNFSFCYSLPLMRIKTRDYFERKLMKMENEGIRPVLMTSRWYKK